MKIKINDKDSLDLQKLIESRLLIQANSGGGKSWLLRRILEQSHGKVQQIILDPEGEFATLRTKYDYILAGKTGDTPAESRSAALLARKLLELGTSAIIDLYELHPQERKHFVKLFLESLVNSPKELWHPVMVVIDEAHTFVPEHGDSEAANAVIGLCSLGRKRGFGAILATQRISKLHKDAAAECNNKLIGRTGLDIDRKRAGEELGFTSKEEFLSMRTLNPGEFYAFGPAISNEVIKVTVGSTETTHPKYGSGEMTKSVPPTDAIKKVLAKLADLPKEAEKEATTVKELLSANLQLKRDIKILESKKETQPTKIEKIEVPMIGKRALERFEKSEKNIKKMVKQAMDMWRAADEVSQGIISAVEKLSFEIKKVQHPIMKPGFAFDNSYNTPKPGATTQHSKVNPLNPVLEKPYKVPQPEFRGNNVFSETRMGQGEKKILAAVAQHEQITREHLTVLTGYKRSSRDAYLQRLQSKGYVNINDGTITITEAGTEALGTDYRRLPTGEALQQHLMQSLPEGEKRILTILITNYPAAVDREEISVQTGYQRSSRDAYLQRLSARQLIVQEGRGLVKATDKLF